MSNVDWHAADSAPTTAFPPELTVDRGPRHPRVCHRAHAAGVAAARA